MASESDEIWEERLNNQKWPLIGSNVKGQEGNGYNDQVVFSPPMHIHAGRREASLSSSTYFENLCNRIDPSISLIRDRDESFFELENCSENYFKTFSKYFGSLESWGRERALDELRVWSQHLTYHGRLIMEFVSWFDNDSDNFYAFELKVIRCELFKEKRNSFVFAEPEVDETGQVINVIKREVLREKCIVLEWPKELGGYKAYKKKKKEIAELGDKFDLNPSIFQPGLALKKWKSHDKSFNQIVGDWGVIHLPEGLSHYYRYYNDFKLKRTSILCVKEMISGVEQVVKILNKKLNEDAKIVFTNPAYDLDRFDTMLKTFKNGELSFSDSLHYIHKEH
ncbi:MAG: hypothetical protein ABJO02_20035 [Reichenbachiella sp.]|uniref:hypothetical protein n=1 Tax=Reichenbachiella sp. TaxID=2184521 RepID=UPI0032993CC4